jgi:hypothetical protein
MSLNEKFEADSKKGIVPNPDPRYNPFEPGFDVEQELRKAYKEQVIIQGNPSAAKPKGTIHAKDKTKKTRMVKLDCPRCKRTRQARVHNDTNDFWPDLPRCYGLDCQYTFTQSDIPEDE